jgi:hypothetical protein
MAKHEVADNKIGSYANKLTAATFDEVAFTDSLKAVEVTSDGSAAIYFTTDGSAPTVAGPNTHEIPAVPAARTSVVSKAGATVVKLISAGTPTYSVARATS